MDTREGKIESFLTFSLGNEAFAFNVDHVEKILEYQPVTEVPKAPEYMLGVINIRGEVVPLIDTKIKFGMAKTEINAGTCILVLHIEVDNEFIKLGALVDTVTEVVKYNSKDILALPKVGKKNKSEFINGVLKINEKFVFLLDCNKIFSVDEIIKLKTEDFKLQMSNAEE